MATSQLSISVTILAEARELLSALRSNRRFGYLLPFTTAAQPAEHPLVKDLKALRDMVRTPVLTPTATQHATSTITSSQLISPDVLQNALEPFFEVVRSRDASGIITGVALQSISRIAYHLINLATASDNLAHYVPVFSAIIEAAAACRFDATDPAGDEVVVSRITRIITTICVFHVVPLLPDATLLRAVEACLAIASGRRRASDLLRRTADLAIVDLFQTLARNVSVIAASSKPATVFPSVFAHSESATSFAHTLNCDEFSQHGPATLSIIVALIQLSSRMADPYYAQSSAERALGLQLLSNFIPTAGSSLRSHIALKRVLLRDCARGLLRSLGLFKSPASVMAYAFTISVQLVHALDESAAPFLLALLERVFPFYISGLENVSLHRKPNLDPAPLVDSSSSTSNGPAPVSLNGSLFDPNARELDPVIREIGLEALADLLSIPGLLCLVYRLADCDLGREDIVEPLLKSLGYSAKISPFRRRSKRLRASTSGANRLSATPEADSDDDDDIVLSGAKSSAESARFGRSAALLCADATLSVIDTISDRLKLETAGLSKPPFMNKDALETSKVVRSEKVRLQKAAKTFNAQEKINKAAKLVNMLREHGLARSNMEEDGTVQEDLDNDVRAIVTFLRETPGLSKEKIGNVLGEPDKLSRSVLTGYTGTFDFKNRAFTESLRVYLESFRLPGEAQKIDRIVQSFANRYFDQNKPGDATVKPNIPAELNSLKQLYTADTTNANSDARSSQSTITSPEHGELNVETQNVEVLKSADAAYVLSFSVVMLNTDQHNESIRKKMTFDDFTKNCRGINDGEDLPKWFLAQVFDSIAAVEIRMSDEAGVGALTDLVWDEQLRKAGAFEKKFPRTSESLVFDEQVYYLSWEAGIVAANSILIEAGEPNSVQKALEGFLSISRCASMYKISLPTDAVVSSLCTATTVRDGPLNGAVVRFGTDIKAQMASVALSGVSRECGDWIRAVGWKALVAYLLRLHALCLLPNDLEKRIGGYGSELTGLNKEEISASMLAPRWWPSQSELSDEALQPTKPRKATRPNGFFAAILAASIGSEMGDDEEEGEEDHAWNTTERGPHRISHSPPIYVRTRTREDTEARDLARKCIASCCIEDVVISEAKVLQSESLGFLCRSVSQAAQSLMDMKSTENRVSGNGNLSPSSEDAVLDWDDIAPPSPKNNSSIIAGVLSKWPATTAETENEFLPFGLSQPWEGSVRERDERKAKEFVISFCIDVLCELTLQNRDRLDIPWPELHGLLVRIISQATEPSAVLERAVVALLRVGVRLLHREQLHDDVLRGFSLLVRLPAQTTEALSVPLAAGVFNIIKGHGSVIENTSGWHALLSILESLARHPGRGRDIGLQTIRWILSERTSSVAVSPETYAPLLDAILAYTTSPSVDVSIQALEMLSLLSEKSSLFSPGKVAENSAEGEQKLEDVTWSEYWGPLFLGFASAVRDARGKVRNCALGVLERVIASGGSTDLLTAKQWEQVLSSVILPLMSELFTTHGYLSATLEAEQEAQRRIFEERNTALGNGGRTRGRAFSTSTGHEELLVKSVNAACSRTRMRAVMLTSKTFLQHHMAIAEGLSEDTFTELWVGVLEVFRVAVTSDAKLAEESEKAVTEDNIKEHVPECVKNMLLVMCDCGLLKQEQHVRWNATFTLVRSFIPDIDDVVSAATKSHSGEGGSVVEGKTIPEALTEEKGNSSEKNTQLEEEKSQSTSSVVVST